MTYKINKKFVESLQTNDYINFNKRLNPYLAGILSTNEPVIIHPDKTILNLSSYKDPLDLSNRDLTSYNLKKCNLTYSKMLGTNCHKVDFENSILDFVNFKNAELSEANFKNASLIYTNFSSTRLINAEFSNSDLLHTNFVKRVITKTSNDNCTIDYIGSDLSNINAVQSFISNVEFKCCNLFEAILNGAKIKNSVFEKNNLIKTNFNSCTINNVYIQHNPHIIEMSMENANIESLCIKNSFFSKCSFSNTIFIDLELDNVAFHECNFYSCEFINSNISHNNVLFNDCNFYKSKFSLSSISFDERKFVNCNLKGVKLDSCEIYVQDKAAPQKHISKDVILLCPVYKEKTLLEEKINLLSRQ